MKKNNDEYYPPVHKVIDGCNVTVYVPILTDEERERRMKGIKEAAVRLFLSLDRENQKLNTQERKGSSNENRKLAVH